jgi:arabinan endo-1,5-alpha-L-arabinosidase
MSENQHEFLIRGNDRFVGTGHNSEIVTDKAGKTWMLYHAVDINNPKGRVLMLDEVIWTDNWPSVKDNTASLSHPIPTF